MQGPKSLILTALAAIGSAILAVVAHRIVGFPGVLIAGLAIVFVAVRVDLEKDHAVGAGLYVNPNELQARNRATSSERAAQRSELTALRRPLLAAKLIGALLALVGLLGWLLT